MKAKNLWEPGEVLVDVTVDVSRKIDAIVNQNLTDALASMEAEKMAFLQADDGRNSGPSIVVSFGDGDWCDYNFTFKLRDLFNPDDRHDEDDKRLAAHLRAALDEFCTEGECR